MNLVTSDQKKSTRFALGLFVILAIVYGWRLTLGVDLSDESYYAIPPVAWLRSTPEETGCQGLSQFVGAILYPFVYAYSRLVPDLTGLILFLRVVYATITLLSAVLLYRTFRLSLTPLGAGACASIFWLFIPFGLPGPGYNAWGLCGITSGSCLLAGLLRRREAGGYSSKGDWARGMASSACFAVATVTYPPLGAAALASLMIFALLFRRNWRAVVAVGFGWLACIGVLAVWIAFTIGGFDRMMEAVRFTGKVGAGADLSARVRHAWNLLRGSGLLWQCVLAMLVLGIDRRLAPCRPTRLIHYRGILVATGLVVWARKAPSLYTPGNDLMFLLAVSAIPALRWPGRAPASRSLMGLGLVGLAGMGVVTLSAVMTLLSTGVMGVLLASVGFALWLSERETWTSVACTWALALAVGATTCLYLYGEFNIRPPTTADEALIVGRRETTERIRRGPFAGLKTQPARAAMMRELTQELNEHYSDCRTVDVYGRQPGLYLVTPYRLLSPNPFPLTDDQMRGLKEHLEEFYDDPANLPDLVIEFKDAYYVGANTLLRKVLAAHYSAAWERGPITIYRRNDPSRVVAP